MTRRRVIIVIAVVAVLAGAWLSWRFHGRDQGVVGAASRPRPADSEQDSVGAASRLRGQSRYGAATARPRSGPASTPRPHPAAPADEFPSLEGQGVGLPKTQAQPPGLERVSSIINAADSARLYERARAVRTIPTPLTETEAEAFARYLLTPAPNAPNRDYENWLRNEMMDVLVDQPVLPQGLADLLVAIFNNHKQDVVMRDYAVQHMAPSYELVSPQEQARLQAALWQATTETDTSLAGTALLALLDVVGPMPSSGAAEATGGARPPGAPPSSSGQLPSSGGARGGFDRLAQTALKLANDDRCGELARISAVQVCGRMRVEQALPVIQRLALEAESIPLRVAATAALGDYAMDQARPEAVAAGHLLAQLAESSDARQSLAAQSALRRLSKQATR